MLPPGPRPPTSCSAVSEATSVSVCRWHSLVYPMSLSCSSMNANFSFSLEVYVSLLSVSLCISFLIAPLLSFLSITAPALSVWSYWLKSNTVRPAVFPPPPPHPGPDETGMGWRRREDDFFFVPSLSSSSHTHTLSLFAHRYILPLRPAQPCCSS